MFLLFKPFSLWYFVMAAQADKYSVLSHVSQFGFP